MLSIFIQHYFNKLFHKQPIRARSLTAAKCWCVCSLYACLCVWVCAHVCVPVWVGSPARLKHEATFPVASLTNGSSFWKAVNCNRHQAPCTENRGANSASSILFVDEGCLSCLSGYKCCTCAPLTHDLGQCLPGQSITSQGDAAGGSIISTIIPTKSENNYRINEQQLFFFHWQGFIGFSDTHLMWTHVLLCLAETMESNDKNPGWYFNFQMEFLQNSHLMRRPKLLLCIRKHRGMWKDFVCFNTK